MKVVFLDRDGVINEFPGHGNYVTKVKEFHFLPGSLEAIRKLTEEGYSIFVISNQAGVGKGIYSEEKLKRINAHMLRQVIQKKGKIKRSFYCTHRSDAGCDCRKPGIGSVKKALLTLNKTIRHAKKAFFVGDTGTDIKAGHTAGCKTIFVLSGHENRRQMKAWDVKPDFIAKNLLEASEIIQNENSHYPRNGRGRP